VPRPGGAEEQHTDERERDAAGNEADDPHHHHEPPRVPLEVDEEVAGPPDQMLNTPTPATARPATTTRTRPPGIPRRVAVMPTVDCRLVCPEPTAKAQHSTRR
jgi:hypothetical protein